MYQIIKFINEKNLFFTDRSLLMYKKTITNDMMFVNERNVLLVHATYFFHYYLKYKHIFTTT